MPEGTAAPEGASQRVSEGVAQRNAPAVDSDIQAFLDSLDGGTVSVFKSEASLEQAKAQGRIKTGDQVILNGKVVTV
jgi:hypothetical protein